MKCLLFVLLASCTEIGNQREKLEVGLCCTLGEYQAIYDCVAELTDPDECWIINCPEPIPDVAVYRDINGEIYITPECALDE